MTVKLFAFAASLRQASWNRKLLNVAAEVARAAGAAVDVAEFREFDMPLYDADLEASQGIPAGAQLLIRRIRAADGLLLASPEYNNSMPGTLKNAIDWVSREKPAALRGKSAMLLSTSSGLVGGNRGLWALRIPLAMLGVHVQPDMFSLAQSDKAFDATGQLADPVVRERLGKMVQGYVRVATALAGS
ncbi:MAG: NAD(P)H-dependent oxidoreductase [Gemmatimonadota bacterium]|nr:NAD(P)H-dependent oxidoreductase [Gemmatimonadota bacterium]